MDALDAVGAPELRDALLFVRSCCRPVAANELAAARSIHPNVARHRLSRLAEAGLLVTRLERRSGRSGPGAGRPARLYSPAPELIAIEFPARHYEELIGLLAASSAGQAREDALEQAGVAFAARLLAESPLAPADDPRAGLERLCETLGGWGYQATLEAFDGRGAVIATPTCPLRPLVVRRPETVEIDRGLWRGLAEAAVAGATVAGVCCRTSGCLDDHASCRVVLEFEATPAPVRT